MIKISILILSRSLSKSKSINNSGNNSENNSELYEDVLFKENKKLRIKLEIYINKCKILEKKLEDIYNYQKRIKRLQDKMFDKNNRKVNKSFDGNSLRVRYLKLPKI